MARQYSVALELGIKQQQRKTVRSFAVDLGFITCIISRWRDDRRQKVGGTETVRDEVTATAGYML